MSSGAHPSRAWRCSPSTDVDRTERLSDDVLRQGLLGCIGVIVRHDTAGELLGFGEVSVLCQLTEGRKAPAAIADLIFPGIGLG